MVMVVDDFQSLWGGGLIVQGEGVHGGVLGERCKLTRSGLGRSPSRFNFSVLLHASTNFHQCMVTQ